MSAADGGTPTDPMRKAWSFHRVLEMQKYHQSRSERQLMVANGFLHRLSIAHIGSDLRDHLSQVSDAMRSRLHNDATPPTNIDKPEQIRKKMSEETRAEDVADVTVSETATRHNRMSSKDDKKRLKQRLRLMSKSPHSTPNGSKASLPSMSFDSSSPPQSASVPSAIIVGSKQTGKSTIIRAMQDCQSARERDGETNERDRLFSNKEPLFIEVNCQKDDLWSSITTHAFVIVFSTDKAESQVHALDCLAMLRTRQSTCALPIFLVANMVRPSCEHVTLKDSKNVAARYNTPFMKISPFARGEKSGVEELTNWLHTNLYNPHPFSSRKERHHRTTSGGRNRPRNPVVALSQFNRRASRSCEDLLLLRQKLSITK